MRLFSLHSLAACKSCQVGQALTKLVAPQGSQLTERPLTSVRVRVPPLGLDPCCRPRNRRQPGKPPPTPHPHGLGWRLTSDSSRYSQRSTVTQKQMTAPTPNCAGRSRRQEA